LISPARRQKCENECCLAFCCK